MHLGRLARRALAGASWRAACLVHPLACLRFRAGEVRHGMCHDGLPRKPSNSCWRVVRLVFGHLMLAGIHAVVGSPGVIYFDPPGWPGADKTSLVVAKQVG